MLLVMDVGNTNIKTGVFEDNKLMNSWRLTTNLRRTADEYGAQMESFFRHIGVKTSAVTSVIMSSVIPSINYTIEHMCDIYFHSLKPLTVSNEVKTGLTIRYDTPSKFGADRICSCAAAHARYGGPLIVIDFGTATTFNVISANGEVFGGLIIPGLKVASDALTDNAALLPQIELVKPKHVICTNTIDSLQSGIINGYAGMVRHLVEMICAERNETHMVVVTGGMSSMIAKESGIVDIIDPTLTLEGLALIAEMNGLK